MGHIFQMPAIIWSTITQNALSSGKQEVGSFSSVKKTEISVQHDKSQISETRLAMQSFTYQNPQFSISLDSSLLSKEKPTCQLEMLHRALASPQNSSRKRSSSPRPAMLLQQSTLLKSQQKGQWWPNDRLVRKTNINCSTNYCFKYKEAPTLLKSMAKDPEQDFSFKMA